MRLRHALLIALAGFALSQFMSCSKKEEPTVEQTFAHNVNIKSVNNGTNLVAVGDNFRITGDIDVNTRFGNSSNWTYSHRPDKGFKFLWSFGDGTQDSLISKTGVISHTISHVYKAAGTYNVTLVCDDSLRSEPLEVNVCADPGYTKQICNQRIWTGGQFSKNSEAPVNLPDSTFALTYYDKVSIDLWGQRYVYSPSSSTSTMLQFGEGGTYGIYIRYYPARDSISFFYARNGSASSGQLVPLYKVWYHTP